MKENREILTARYKALYGETRGEKKAEADFRKTRRRYLTILLILPVVVVLQILSDHMGDLNVRENKTGSIVKVERPKEGAGYIDARVTAKKGKVEVDEDKQILVRPEGGDDEKNERESGILSAETDEERLKRKLDSAVREVNGDVTGSEVVLPSKLDDGTQLKWQKKNNSRLLLTVGGFLLLAFLIYAGRYETVRREEKKAGESVLKELPEFINKTVLMLKGGVVISDALRRAITEGAAGREDSYFYSQMIQVEHTSKMTNSPLQSELAKFSKRCGVKEMMRVSNIINDNIKKGSDLTEKLTRESNMLWFARKKQAEEKGRLAETKLTLPLVILILVLVMITVAPALLEING